LTSDIPKKRADVKPEFEVIVNEPGRSFRIYQHDHSHAIAKWNYHPEYELHLITKTRGTMFVGDCIEEFYPGNLCLIGPNIPHDWTSNIGKDEVVVGRDIVIQFTANSIGLNENNTLPEMDTLKELLKLSHLGLIFSGPNLPEVHALMKKMRFQEGLAAYASFLSIMAILATKAEKRTLVSPHYKPNLSKETTRRIQMVFEEIYENLNKEIKVSKFCKKLDMSPSTFSRFFQKNSGMNFSSYLRKMRLGRACYLLSNTDQKVVNISANSGFKNLSNFNRHFKEEMNMTPSQYRYLSRTKNNESDYE